MTRALVKNASRANPPNLIINGAMDFWQRNTSISGVSSSELYAAPDRFRVRGAGGGPSVSITRSATVPSNKFKYSALYATAGGSNTRLIQPIEAASIKPYIGKTMTASVWVNPSTNTQFNISVYTPVSGVEDSWNSNISSNDTLYYTQDQFLTLGVWQRIFITFVVPSTAVNGLAVSFVGAFVAGSTALVTGMMLTEGTTPPADFYRAGDNIQAELAMCQRYYEKSYEIDTVPGTLVNAGVAWGTAGSTTTARLDIAYKVTKRGTPITIVLHNPDVANTGEFRVQTTNVAGSIAVSGTKGFGLVNTVGGAFTVSDQVKAHWTASAEL